MKHGTTSFQEGCMKDVSFEDFEKDHKKEDGKIVFRDMDNNMISNKEMFKAMGGVIKPAKKSIKEKD